MVRLMLRLKPFEKAMMSGETFHTVRTIERVYEGGPCKGPTRARIERAAIKLRLPLPPPPAAPPEPQESAHKRA
jgi:hypothetical protein